MIDTKPTPSATNLVAKNYNPEAAIYIAGNVIGTFITAVNELVDAYMTDSYALLVGSKFFKQNIKRNARLARKAMDDTVRYARNHLKPDRQEFYFTYIDKYYERMKKDVKILELSILQVLTKADVPDRRLIAMMETTRIMLKLAMQAYDELFSDIKRTCLYDVSHEFSGYRPASADHLWSVMFDELLRKIHGFKVNLNDSPEINLAYKIIQRKFVNGEYLDVVAEETVSELYPNEQPEPTANDNV